MIYCVPKNPPIHPQPPTFMTFRFRISLKTLHQSPYSGASNQFTSGNANAEDGFSPIQQDRLSIHPATPLGVSLTTKSPPLPPPAAQSQSRLATSRFVVSSIADAFDIRQRLGPQGFDAIRPRASPGAARLPRLLGYDSHRRTQGIPLLRG